MPTPKFVPLPKVTRSQEIVRPTPLPVIRQTLTKEEPAPTAPSAAPPDEGPRSKAGRAEVKPVVVVKAPAAKVSGGGSLRGRG